jgi:hypothetical protein
MSKEFKLSELAKELGGYLPEMFIVLAGNIGEGFKAYGPYSELDKVCVDFDGLESWIMQLRPGPPQKIMGK